VVFLCYCEQMQGYYFKLRHDRFLPDTILEFIVHHHPTLRRCIAWTANSVEINRTQMRLGTEILLDKFGYCLSLSLRGLTIWNALRREVRMFVTSS
jgi:hypothetical protein